MKDNARLAIGAAIMLVIACASYVTPARAAESVCEPPVSTCSDPGSECPAGYGCICVPSCPNCRDCPVRVCVVDDNASCRTACDCEPGLGCFDGQCIAGFAPVFCCEGEQCPAGEQCQHRDGRMSRCSQSCSTPVWTCDTPGQVDQCGEGRVCSCTASCPFCDDCGPGVCVAPTAPTPYRCSNDGSCSQPGDRCVCAASCPACLDCPFQVCVPACGPDCDELRDAAEMRVNRIVDRASRCRSDDQCVRVATSTQCGGTCGAWVNRRVAPFVERAMKYVDRKVCAPFRAQDCPYATPGCLAERGVCAAGRCSGVAVGIE